MVSEGSSEKKARVEEGKRKMKEAKFIPADFSTETASLHAAVI